MRPGQEQIIMRVDRGRACRDLTLVARAAETACHILVEERVALMPLNGGRIRHRDGLQS